MFFIAENVCGDGITCHVFATDNMAYQTAAGKRAIELALEEEEGEAGADEL